MENFTPISALIGGALIGLSASLYLLLQGRIAGISGILGRFLQKENSDSERANAALFLLGLIGGVVLYRLLTGNTVTVDINPFQFSTLTHLGILVVAGLAVGFGTARGSGCTSGHGVCGIARLSMRSILATGTFMVTAALTVFIVRMGLGA